MKMFKRAFLAASVAAFAAAVPLLAEDFSDVKGAPKWKVYDVNHSNRAFRSRIPDLAPSGGMGFDFLFTPDTALLTTDHPSYRGSLLGDLKGKLLSATIKLNFAPGTQFQYYGQGTPANPCPTPAASVRFFFQGNTNGPFAYTKYWWSNPTSVQLANLVNGIPLTIMVHVQSGLWSDYSGQFDAAGFDAAAKDVQTIGLSFGGGCFFENGVGIMPGGSGSFQLLNISATLP